MKKLFTAALAAALLAPCAAHGAAPSLRVYRDDEARDTVYSPVYYVIGVTAPSARATVDGRPCKVYATGAFGAEVTLTPGENLIRLCASDGRDSTAATERVVYMPAERRPAPAPAVTRPLDAPLYVVTADGAYLQHGNGADRLGGSKMNYLPPGIELTATGETDGLYQVALGANNRAYIPKSAVTAGAGPAPTVNTGSATLENTGRTDRLTISLPRRLPFYSRCETDPSTILITLYGATNNTNWLRQTGRTEMVEFVDLRRDGADALTVVLRLRDKYQWGYSVTYDGTNMVIDVRHRPASLQVKDLTIGLDAGHGGRYLGAVSPSGLREKDVNLDIVLKAAAMLRDMGARVVLTRDGDTGPSMAERRQTWLEGGVDIAVSVHNNASGNPLVPMGTSCYYKHISNRVLAMALHDSLLGLGLNDFGLTGNFNFSLNAPTEYPNALAEVLFMSSLPEEELLADPDYRTRLARSLVDGILNYLETVKRSL